MTNEELIEYGKHVGAEARRTFEKKVLSGFFEKYMNGKGLDIGGTGYLDNVKPILPTAQIVDLDYPGYDGVNLPFKDEEFDYIYSSHCLEHVHDVESTLKEWYRVVKTNGYLVLAVPHQFLYERKKNPPSKWNGDHKFFFTPGKLLTHIENTLEPNSYRVRLLEDGDDGYDYSVQLKDHANGQYEITAILQKIQKPDWNLE